MTYPNTRGNGLVTLTKKKSVFEILAKKFGEEYLDYRKRWQEAGERKAFYRVPIQLDIDLTNLCNMACTHCNALIYPSVPSVKKHTIDIDVLKNRLAESIPLGIKSINFGNGSEPLISGDKVFDLLSHVKKLGAIDIFLHTNGLLLSDRNIDKIINSGITVLCISIDAYREETYRKIGRKDFKKVVSNIMRFLEKRSEVNSKLPILRLSFLPNEHNYLEVDDFVQFWRDRADKVELQSFFNIHKSKRINEIKSFEKYTFECKDPWKRLPIWPNNTYGVCCQYYSFRPNSPLNLGSIYDYSIEEVWHSSKMNNIRKGLKNNNFSKECYECTHNMFRCNTLPI